MWLVIVLDANKEEMKEKHLALQWLPLYVGKNPNCLPLLTLTWPEDENPPKQNQCSDNQYKEGDQGLEWNGLKDNQKWISRISPSRYIPTENLTST